MSMVSPEFPEFPRVTGAPSPGTANYRRDRRRSIVGVIAVTGAAAALLYLLSLWDWLLFLSVTELFTIVVAAGIFIIAWNIRHRLPNHFLLFLGIAYLSVALVDTFHLLAYRDIGSLPTHASNEAIQLWVLASYVEGFSLLVSPFFVTRRARVAPLAICYGTIVGLGLLSIWQWGIFPVCFIESHGPTMFRIVSAYVIAGLLSGAIVHLRRYREQFQPLVFKLLVVAMAVMIAREMSLVLYTDAHGSSTMVAHILKVVSFYLIYRAIVVTHIATPYEQRLRDIIEARDNVQRERDVAQRYLDIAGVMLVALDTHGKVSLINRKGAEVLGYSADEIVGRDWFGDFLPDTQHDAARGVFQRLLAGEDDAAREVENAVLSRSGEQRIIKWHNTAIRDAGGKVVGTLSSGEDITGRARMQSVLRESEEKYRSLFEQSMDAICLVTPGGRILEANRAWLDLFGHSKDEVASLNVEDQYVDPEERTRFLVWMATHDTLVDDEVQFRRKDGTVMDCLHSAIVRRAADGSITGYQSVIRVITEVVRLQRSERQQRMFAERLMETSPACVLAFDAEGKVTSANPETERVLGLTREDVLGMAAGKELMGLDPSGNPLQDGPVRCAIRTGLPVYGVECAMDLPHGRRIISVSAAPLFADDDNTTGAVATLEDITERKQMEEDIRRSYDTQAAINTILKLSLEDLSLEQILERALDSVLSIPWLVFESRGAIFLVEDESDVLIMKAQRGLALPIQQACSRLPFGRCLCGRAAQMKETQFADRLDSRHEITYEGITHHGHYCLPIVSAGKVLGVVNVYTREGHRRDKREDDFLNAVANTLAGIIERKRREQERERLLERLQKALDATIEAMSAAVDARDPYTSGHQRRVALIAGAIASEMGAGDEVRQAVYMAGQVHDLGKLQIPAEILSKPGRLSRVEFELIKCHSQAGYDILKNIDFPWPIADMVLQHHERLDGSGYPQGLKGNQTRLEARILAIADVFEAMSSHRPYRAALGVEAALEELQRNRGKLFDPDAVDACVRLVRDRGFTLE